MKVKNTNCKEYWENYTDYWKNRVCETNEDSNVKDKTLADSGLKKYLQLLNISNKDNFLDFGCGFCRLYEGYKALVGKNGNYYGVDIAKGPIEMAYNTYPELKNNGCLQVFDGIRTPFDEGEFDKIACIGVFDACDQEETIKELLRILKINGLLLLTGKNINYCDDDEQAYIAEINARKKGHPNSFTDVLLLENLLTKNEGVDTEIISHWYAKRRGDAVVENYVMEAPERFYEWRLLIKKNGKTNFEKGISQFSDVYSDTYKRKIACE